MLNVFKKAVFCGDLWGLFAQSTFGDLFRGKGYSSGLVLSVDGIPYEVPYDLAESKEVTALTSLMAENTLVVFQVGVSAVGVGYRESLEDTPKTRAEINRLASIAAADLKGQVLAILAGFTNVQEMLSKTRELRGNIDVANLCGWSRHDTPRVEIKVAYPSKTVQGYTVPARTYRLLNEESFEVDFGGGDLYFENVKVKGSRLDFDRVSHYLPTNLDNVLVLDEPALKPYKCKQKIKHWLQQRTPHLARTRKTLVVSTSGFQSGFNPEKSGMLLAILGDLGLTPSSQVELPLTPAKARAARGESLKGKDALHVVHGSKESYSTAVMHVERDALEEAGEFVYAEKKEDLGYSEEFIGQMSLFLKSRDIKLVLVSSRVKNHVAECENFQSLDDYVNEFKSSNCLTQDEVKAVQANHFPDIPYGLEDLRPHLSSLKDPCVAEILSEHEKFKKYPRVDHLGHKVLELAPAVKSVTDAMKVWHDKVAATEKRYGLYFSELYQYLRGPHKDDVIDFLNMKFAQASNG